MRGSHANMGSRAIYCRVGPGNQRYRDVGTDMRYNQSGANGSGYFDGVCASLGPTSQRIRD